MNKLEFLKLIANAPKNLKGFEEIFNYARNAYKQMMGVFPDGIDNIFIKQAAKEASDNRKKIIQFPRRGKKEGIEKLIEEGDITVGTAPKTTKVKPDVDPELQAIEDQNKMFQNFSIRNLSPIEAMKEASSLIGRRGKYKNISESDAKKLLDELDEKIKSDMGPIQSEGDDIFAGGGRVEMKFGGILNFIKSLLKKKKSPSEDFAEYLKEMQKESDRLNKEFYKGLEEGGELDQNVEKIKKGYQFPKVGEEFKKKIKERMDKRRLQDFDTEGRKPNAMGGRIEMVGGGPISKLLKILSKKSPLQRYKDYLKSVERRAKADDAGLVPEMVALASTGILGNRFLQRKIKQMNEQDEEKDKKAMGGRIGFNEGGMSRRTFLKLMGGLASLPVVGKLFKTAKPAAKVVEATKEFSSGVPAYFTELIKKIKLLGDDVTETAATTERQKVTQYKGYELTEDISTGKKQIKIGDAEFGKEEYMIYDPPEIIIGKNKKPVEIPAQYDEVTVKPDMDGKMKDVDSGLDSYDKVLEEVRMKKSGGGVAYMLGE
tara:strand:- start:756 stop:2384 length:1629 start_codon:yes stop_codon:yes gene_type:complete